MNKILFKNPFCQWEITTACNNNCEGCNVFNAPISDPISLDIAVRGVKDLAMAGIQTLEFIGGEPYAYPHMLKLIEHIHQNRPEIKRFAILTNGLNNEALEKTKPFLSKNRGGIVLSINYTKNQCEKLLKQGTDVAMARKSLAGWQILDEFVDICWVRINCLINRLNIETVSQIGEQVVRKGALFSFCPFVYKRVNSPSTTLLTFRSQEIGLAPLIEQRQLMEKTVKKLIKLKQRYTDLIVPSLDYINFLPKTCKNPEDPYPINCGGLGLPYIRISSKTGQSKIDGIRAPRLRACTDVFGDGSFSEIVTSDLKYSRIIDDLSKKYQQNPQVQDCIKNEGCPWSVTFALSRQK